MSEYVEFYGDHVFLVQMSPNIAQISTFTNFRKNRISFIFRIFLKKGRRRRRVHTSIYIYIYIYIKGKRHFTIC